MSSRELDNLVKIGTLRAEAPSQDEFDGLLQSGSARLGDARKPSLSAESRFDLAYNAAHALALAALRHRGLRPENRYVVFEVLPHTLGVTDEIRRILVTCHGQRNTAEYEGFLDVGDQLLADLIKAAGTLLSKVSALPRIEKPKK